MMTFQRWLDVNRLKFVLTEYNLMFHYLYLGNLMVEKGVLVLLEACALMKNSCSDFCCHIVGASSSDLTREEVDILVRERNLEEIVQVHGALYGEEKEEFLKKMDALVFPTYYHNECFPFVILEAMKCSLPVISTEEGAIPDMVQDGRSGLLVERENSHALAEAMCYLVNHREEARSMGSRGREMYEANFTEDVFLNNVRAMLREL